MSVIVSEPFGSVRRNSVNSGSRGQFYTIVDQPQQPQYTTTYIQQVAVNPLETCQSELAEAKIDISNLYQENQELKKENQRLKYLTESTMTSVVNQPQQVFVQRVQEPSYAPRQVLQRVIRINPNSGTSNDPDSTETFKGKNLLKSSRKL